jgi:hypothetical protein
MVARGGARDATATPGARTTQRASPGGATEPSRSVRSPLRGFVSFRTVYQGLRSFAFGSLAPPLATIGRRSAATAARSYANHFRTSSVRGWVR